MNDESEGGGARGRRAARGAVGRGLRTLLVFAALGALVAGMVAALGAIWVPLGARVASFSPEEPGARPILAQLPALPASWGAPYAIMRQGNWVMARWSVTGNLTGEASGSFVITHIEAGFPARCLVATRLWDSEAGDQPGPVWRAGVVVPPGLRPWRHDPRGYNDILPLRPRIVGWLINIAFYGGLLWLVCRGSGLARGAWRRRRGRCPKCGYPRGEAGPCPECGAAE